MLNLSVGDSHGETLSLLLGLTLLSELGVFSSRMPKICNGSGLKVYGQATSSPAFRCKHQGQKPIVEAEHKSRVLAVIYGFLWVN